MANPYKAQGCAFIVGCIFVGFLLSLLTTFSAEEQVDGGQVVEPASTTEKESTTSAGDQDINADESASDLRPQWLHGTWAPVGECGVTERYFFRFDPDGSFASNEISGTYGVRGDQIEISDVQATEEMLKSLGGDGAAIQFARDESTGEVWFKNIAVERCDV